MVRGMTDNGQIDILMATYNGAAHLPAQLASLLAQTHGAWRLIVRDDGSTDATVAILRAFAAAHPGRVVLIEDDLGNLRTLRNFATVLARSDARYCGFCDQDDIWDADKLAVAMAAMRELESGTDGPALVVTDRRVADDAGRAIAASFWDNQGIHPRNVRNMTDLLVYPVAAGSSMLMNAALRARAQPIPEAAIQYDCWVELVAMRFGAVRYVERPLLTHLRHAQNVAGGGRTYASTRYVRRAMTLLGGLGRQRKVYHRYLRQAEAFLDRFGPDLAEGERARLTALLAMRGTVWPVRLWHAARAAGLPPTWERRLAFFFLV